MGSLCCALLCLDGAEMRFRGEVEDDIIKSRSAFLCGWANERLSSSREAATVVSLALFGPLQFVTLQVTPHCICVEARAPRSWAGAARPLAQPLAEARSAPRNSISGVRWRLPARGSCALH